MANLTDKQKIFCDEYLATTDLNVTVAYKKAYPRVKNDDVAAAAGSRLLRNVKVKDYIQKRMKEREKRTEITQDRVLKELADIAFDDIKNYLSFHTDENGDIRVKIKNSTDIDTKNISEISIGKDGQFKFKLYCKDNALVQLGKHLGMFKDKLEVTGNINNPYEGLSTEDLKKLISDG